MNEKQINWVRDRNEKIRDYAINNLEKLNKEEWNKISAYCFQTIDSAKGFENEVRKMVFDVLEEIDLKYQEFLKGGDIK